MTKNMKKAVLVCGAGILLLWSVNGCKSQDKCCATTQATNLNVDGTSFYAENDVPATHKFMNAQAASGARADATFNTIHFDGGKVNSLGTAKIDAILADDDTAEPVVIYLNTEEGDPAKASKQDSIVAYCKSKGLTESQIQFKLGPNPATFSPSADLIRTLSKTDSGAAAGGAPAAAASADAK